ncbi:MAG: hypothetical protein JXA42_13480 [Anaerolineales bacterium]|nr:hypothetical protein [Anaerolineales bacterium]
MRIARSIQRFLFLVIVRQRGLLKNGINPYTIDEFFQSEETGRQLIRSAMQQLAITARAFHRIFKLSRTIADLAGMEQIQPAHPSTTLRTSLAEAIQYRPRR